MAALPVPQARVIVALLCARATRRAMPFERTRARLQRRFKTALVRVFKFAKHETLRKLHRYMFTHRPLVSQSTQTEHHDASRIAFNPDELRQDLNQMLQVQLPDAVQTVASDVLTSVGYSDPWQFPAQDTLDLIFRRQNLLSGVPDEIFAEIQNEIAIGLSQGESVEELARRISGAFDEISATRAELIAQTETAAAYGFASDKAAREAGVEYKQWIHSGLPKEPREDHIGIDGLIVPIDEAYPVGDPPLMFPHDPDGSAEDVINCGCISIPATAEDYAAQGEEVAAPKVVAPKPAVIEPKPIVEVPSTLLTGNITKLVANDSGSSSDVFFAIFT